MSSFPSPHEQIKLNSHYTINLQTERRTRFLDTPNDIFAHVRNPLILFLLVNRTVWDNEVQKNFATAVQWPIRPMWPFL